MSRVLWVSSPRWWVCWCGVLEGGLSTVGLQQESGMYSKVVPPPVYCSIQVLRVTIRLCCFGFREDWYYALFTFLAIYALVRGSWEYLPITVVRQPSWCVLLVYYSSPRYFISCICVCFHLGWDWGHLLSILKSLMHSTFHVGLCDTSKIVLQVHCNHRVECCRETHVSLNP